MKTCKTCRLIYDPTALLAARFHEHVGLAEAVAVGIVKKEKRMNPREALEKIRTLATGRLGRSIGGLSRDVGEIGRICDELLKVPDAPKLPAKECVACLLPFAFNPKTRDHECLLCKKDLCPTCECLCSNGAAG